jgi:hypothetical protein
VKQLSLLVFISLFTLVTPVLVEVGVEISRSYQLSSWSVFDQAKTLSFLLSYILISAVL